MVGLRQEGGEGERGLGRGEGRRSQAPHRLFQGFPAIRLTFAKSPLSQVPWPDLRRGRKGGRKKPFPMAPASSRGNRCYSSTKFPEGDAGPGERLPGSSASQSARVQDEQNSGYEQLRAETALPTPHPTSCLRRGSEGRGGIQLRKADTK